MASINRRQLLCTGFAASAFLPWVPNAAWAQTAGLPKVVKIIVPLAAGGAVDITARKIAEQMGRASGSSFVVENKPGAAGLIAAQAVIQSADPATILYGNSGLVTLQAMTERFNLQRDFKPISKINSGGFLLVVRGNSKFNTLRDLIAAAQANPDALNFGSAGNGSPIHLTYEVMASKIVAGFKVTDIPYKGGSIEAVMALLAGQIDFTYAIASAVSEQIKAGQLRALVVTSAKRAPQFPQVPTLTESGVSGFKRDNWSGLLASAKASDDLVQQLHSLLATAAQTPDVIEAFRRDGAVSEIGQTPAQFAEELRMELDSERLLINKLGLKS